MRRSRIRAVLGLALACVLVFSACGQGTSGAGSNAAGQAGSQAAAGGSGQQEGADKGDTGSAQDNPGADNTGNAQAAGGVATGSDGHGTALIPLLLNEETNALAIGTCEWGGRIVTDATVRHDALEARLRTINAERNPSEGNETVYVTRSDETAVSLVICTNEDNESAVTCQTYTLNPETGKDLRLTDVITDTDGYLTALRKACDEQLSFEGAWSAMESDSEVLEYVQNNWTLDYDGLTVFYAGHPEDGRKNPVFITVYFEGNESLFEERFTQTPDRYMIRMLPGRTYAQIGDTVPVRMERGEVVNKDKVPEYHQTMRFGELELQVYTVRDYSTWYLVCVRNHGFVLRESPRLETTYLPDSYVSDLFDLEQADAYAAPESVMVPYGLADRGALDPGHLRLYDDTFYEKHPAMTKYAITGYAYYEMTTDGGFRREEDFWYLDGPERTAARPVDTLGYRLYDTESLVSKQITRDMQLAAYRTDGETYFEFAGNGDVFRFEIDGLDEGAKLNGTYTFDMLFGT